ncbi:hypothetical protein L204_100565 [Cryptococcus depauperatus]|nr:ATP-dependent RNA helicase DHX37/DHR1 [Cryptococcus depauperatus CBS 7855]
MAGPPVRQKYNAKARGSVAGGSTHKKRKAVSQKGQFEDDAEEDGELEEQDDDSLPAMSSKKRKRFESYMNKKLKSEQRLETFKLLQSLAPSASTSAAFVSASSLGQNPLKPTSAKERQDKMEDRLVRRGIDKLSKRYGEDECEDDDGEREPERKGKEFLVEVIKDKGAERTEDVKTTLIPTKSQLKTEAKVKSKSRGRERLPKNANWNPNLFSSLNNLPSSDFDSSNSENDTADEKEENPQLVSLPFRGSTKPETLLQNTTPSNKLQSLDQSLSYTVLGRALKKSADGSFIKARVEIKSKRPFKYGMFGRRGIDVREGLEESSDDDDDDDETETSDECDSKEEDDVERNLDEEEQDSDGGMPAKKRSLGFKDWAIQQMNQNTKKTIPDVLDAPVVAPTSVVPTTKPLQAARVGQFIGPMGATFEMPTTSLIDQSKGSVTAKARPSITRRPSVSESRMELPILAEEQSIIESILMHSVVIICGETGSGKTTQVPQMLYEAGFGYKGSDNPGLVAVTQPRRVAAVSLAERVRSELNLPPSSSLVAHQIRYSSTISPDTAIKFMTDGVLLRELASDFLLSRYSVVVVDEAHERGVNTDILVGVLSRVAKLREKMWREGKEAKPLRIVIMSATLRVSDFAENPILFSKPPPVIYIQARQHPVTIHFSRKTASDYVAEAYKKVSKIHSRLPPGGVLVFMTGQGEIQALCKKLSKKYGKNKNTDKSVTIVDGLIPLEGKEAEEEDFGKDDDLAADVDDGAAEVCDPEALDTDDEDLEGIERLEFDEPIDTPMHVLPLYSLLQTDQQMLVFRPPPEGHRLVIVATNVAETSVTIPGIRYVVDSGRAKERRNDSSNGVQSFQVSWISKASAAQRAGRAGRTGPGHCYRLYSSALFEDYFEQFSKPEILRMPIEGVVLQMKSMNIDAVVNFPFPTPPERYALHRAENLLINLGALSLPTQTRMINGSQHFGSSGGQITDLGKAMAGYPVSPRFAKMLIIGRQHDCLPYVVAIVAGMSVGDPFIHEQSLEIDEEDKNHNMDHINNEEVKEKEQRKKTRQRFFKAQEQFTTLGQGVSDMFKLLAAIGAYDFEPSVSFCTKNFLRPKAMQEIRQLRNQISSIAQIPFSKLLPPTDTQLKVIRQVLSAGFIDQVAVREDVVQKKGITYESTRGVPYRAVGLESEAVYIHPSSALFHRSPPDFVVFSEIVRTSKPWMKGITKINPIWLPSLGKGLCSFSAPIEIPKKEMTRKADTRNDEREVYVTPHFKDLRVDLPVIKKKQKREGTRWVLVD